MFKGSLQRACAIAGFLVVMGVLSPPSAAAQGVDLSVGYSFLHDNELGENLPNGLFASLGIGVNGWLALVGEVASNRKDYDALVDDVELKVDFYGAGIRFNGRSGRARPYAQVLVGATRGRVSFLGESESGSQFTWQPGAGVDAYFSRNVGLRFGVNGRYIQNDGDTTTKEVQVVVGVVFGGGR